MLKLKIPPPVVALTMVLLAWLINTLLPSFRLDYPVIKLLVYPLAIVGVAIELWSVLLFVKARTTVNPLKPANSNMLVTGGLYRYTRNPMYLGMLMLLSAFVLWVGNPIGLATLPLFVWYLTSFQIKPEEEALVKIFGAQFNEYKQSVRRWI